MKAPYVVGELRTCVDCGADFKREVHRNSYCRACRNERRRQSSKKRPKKEVTPQRRGGPRGCYKMVKPSHTTRKTPLPFCPVCHRYDGMCEHRMVIYG